MDKKMEIMVSLATAIGANCIPCFDHIYARARELDIDDNEIERLMEISAKVKNGAALFMKNAVNDVLGHPQDEEQPCCVQSTEGCC